MAAHTPPTPEGVRLANEIAERFDAADKAGHRAAVYGDAAGRAAAEDEKRKLYGDFAKLRLDAADALLCLWRLCEVYQPEALAALVSSSPAVRGLRRLCDDLAERVGNLEAVIAAEVGP